MLERDIPPCILFTDRVILTAYHCIEEHNFNCKLPVAVASPHCFRCKFLWNILLGRLQSVFPLFISFICVGITVFCCCLDLYKPLLCLLLMVCLRWQLVQSYVLSTRSFLLLSSPSLLMLHFKSRADTKRYIFINRKKYGAIPSLQATIRPCAIPALHTCVEIINLLLWDATLLCKELSHEGILHIESQQGEWNWPWKCHVQVAQVDNLLFY